MKLESRSSDLASAKTSKTPLPFSKSKTEFGFGGQNPKPMVELKD